MPFWKHYKSIRFGWKKKFLSWLLSLIWTEHDNKLSLHSDIRKVVRTLSYWVFSAKLFVERFFWGWGFLFFSFANYIIPENSFFPFFSAMVWAWIFHIEPHHCRPPFMNILWLENFKMLKDKIFQNFNNLLYFHKVFPFILSSHKIHIENKP